MTGAGRSWRLVVASLALVLIGAAVGITFDRLYHRGARMVLGHIAPGARPVFVDAFDLLDSVLVLRQEQRDAVRVVLEERQADIDAIWARTHGSLRVSIDSTAQVLDRILDEPQRVRLRTLIEQLHGPTPNRDAH